MRNGEVFTFKQGSLIEQALLSYHATLGVNAVEWSQYDDEFSQKMVAEFREKMSELDELRKLVIELTDSEDR